MADVQCPRFVTADWMEWIEIFEAFALLKGWDDARKLVAVPLFLSGSAKQAFQSLSAAQRANWALTCAALEQIFTPEDAGAEVQFHARRQLPGETIATFAAALRALGKQAFAGHNEATLEKLLLRQFLIGLNQQVADETARRNPITLAEAVKAAQTALQVRKALNEIQQNHVVTTMSQPIYGVAPAPGCMSLSYNEENRPELDQIKESVTELAKIVRELAMDQRGCPRNEIEVRRPAERAHLHPSDRRGAPDDRVETGKSRKRFRSLSRSPTPICCGSNNLRDDSGPRCFACGGVGHIKRECANERLKSLKYSNQDRAGN